MMVLVLHTEIMPYGVAIYSQLADELDCDVTVVRKDQNRTRGFIPVDTEQIRFLARSEQSRRSLLTLYQQLKPRLIYVSGWIDSDYLQVCLQARRDGAAVVTGLDNQWRGDWRQRLACLASKIWVHRYFSHVQVAGPRQYEFARRLGFLPEQILFDLYSCDMEVFQRHNTERQQRLKRFLFVGRFMEKKGLQELYLAWKMICVESDEWELQLIGDGEELPDFATLPRVILSDYLPPKELARQIENAGAVVIPSRREPWGVVVHEFAAKGMPMILSDAVGAGTAFLIDGYNGFRFRTGDSADLAEKLRRMMKLSDDERAKMGRRSKLLSQRIRPEFSAAQLASLIER